jgi:hypothetical protein
METISKASVNMNVESSQSNPGRSNESHVRGLCNCSKAAPNVQTENENAIKKLVLDVEKLIIANEKLLAENVKLKEVRNINTFWMYVLLQKQTIMQNNIELIM